MSWCKKLWCSAWGHGLRITICSKHNRILIALYSKLKVKVVSWRKVESMQFSAKMKKLLNTGFKSFFLSRKASAYAVSPMFIGIELCDSLLYWLNRLGRIAIWPVRTVSIHEKPNFLVKGSIGCQTRCFNHSSETIWLFNFRKAVSAGRAANRRLWDLTSSSVLSNYSKTVAMQGR